MNTENLLKPALLRIVKYLYINKHVSCTYDEIANPFYNIVEEEASALKTPPVDQTPATPQALNEEVPKSSAPTEEVDKAPKTKRKLDLDSPNKPDNSPKVETEVTPIKKEVAKKPKKQSKEVVETPKEVERSTTPNIPPPEPAVVSTMVETTPKEETTKEKPKVEETPVSEVSSTPKDDTEPKELVIKWFDKKRNLVRDVSNDNILKLVNGEYILVGRYEEGRKTLVDIGKDELLSYKGTINIYDYDQNYYISTVPKASKAPSI